MAKTNGEHSGKKYPAEILTRAEVERLLGVCNARRPVGIRNRALISVIYRTGLRLNEALALAPKDIDVNAGTVRVLHGKGDKARTVGIDPAGSAFVLAWLPHWQRIMDLPVMHPWQPARPLFCTLGGKRLLPSYVRQLFPRLGKKAGITTRCHAHGLRHTHSAELAAEGVPMNMIQAQLGHASLATTDTYLRHILPAELVERIRAREWTPST